MSSKSRRRKRDARRERARVRAEWLAKLALYRSRRLPSETAREQLVRTLHELKTDPCKFIEPATFKFISCGYDLAGGDPALRGSPVVHSER